jgi:hypothetical protein
VKTHFFARIQISPRDVKAQMESRLRFNGVIRIGPVKLGMLAKINQSVEILSKEISLESGRAMFIFSLICLQFIHGLFF